MGWLGGICGCYALMRREKKKKRPVTVEKVKRVSKVRSDQVGRVARCAGVFSATVLTRKMGKNSSYNHTREIMKTVP